MAETRAVTIGQAARRAGLTPKAVRLYESKGLLEPARRTGSGYRLYQRRDVDTLRFVRQARTLGLNLGNIRQIIDLQRQGAKPCQQVLGILDARLREIDGVLRDLHSLRRVLRKARDTAEETRKRGENAVVCCIIESATSA